MCPLPKGLSFSCKPFTSHRPHHRRTLQALHVAALPSAVALENGVHNHGWASGEAAAGSGIVVGGSDCTEVQGTNNPAFGPLLQVSQCTRKTAFDTYCWVGEVGVSRMADHTEAPLHAFVHFDRDRSLDASSLAPPYLDLGTHLPAAKIHTGVLHLWRRLEGAQEMARPVAGIGLETLAGPLKVRPTAGLVQA